MKQSKRYPNWFDAHFRPEKALKTFTATITTEHEEFKKQAMKKRQKNERKLEAFNKEFAGVEAKLDSQLNRKLSKKEIVENESLRKRLKTVQGENDHEIKKIEHDAKLYEEQIEKDYDYQHVLLSRILRNLALVTIVILILFTSATYMLYKSIFPNFGQGVKVEYYSILAQIIPALLIALYLTGYGKSDKDKKAHEDRSIWNKLMSEYRILGIYAFLQGEIACLIAIGRGWSALGVMLASFIGVGILTLLVFTKILERDIKN